MTQYDALAPVYDWLVPDALLEPEGAVAAFAPLLDELPPGARVLDCAAGTGQLAVGLALRGFDVTATDASGAMVERTRALAADARCDRCAPSGARGEELDAGLGRRRSTPCSASATRSRTPSGPPRAALGGDGRRAAPGGLLAVTSRNWERAARAAARAGGRRAAGRARAAARRAAWTSRTTGTPNRLDVAVAVLGADGSVRDVREDAGVLAVHARGAGRRPARRRARAGRRARTRPDAERYLVTARRSAAGAGAGSARP